MAAKKAPKPEPFVVVDGSALVFGRGAHQRLDLGPRKELPRAFFFGKSAVAAVSRALNAAAETWLAERVRLGQYGSRYTVGDVVRIEDQVLVCVACKHVSCTLNGKPVLVWTTKWRRRLGKARKVCARKVQS